MKNMKFFCITKDTNVKTKELLKKSAEERSLEFIDVDVDQFDITEEIVDKSEKNILYRVASGSHAKNIELNLIKKGNLVTFYKDSKSAFSSYYDVPLQEFFELPVPKTVNFIPTDNALLKKAVDYVGGFPVIVKASGLSHGAGVMRIDSLESMLSVVGFLRQQGAKSLMIRQYIDSHRHARLVVLNNEVVDSIEYIVPEDDFRTNAGEPQVHGMKFPKEFEDIAVKAVSSMNLEFGGVDILIDKEENPYLAEVNFPCFFPRNQLTTGVDTSGMMLDYLIQKVDLGK